MIRYRMLRILYERLKLEIAAGSHPSREVLAAIDWLEDDSVRRKVPRVGHRGKETSTYCKAWVLE